MVAFDVDTAIVEFLADPVRSSLELAHMTTGQRKQTKQLLAQYPEVRCESFGFGAERQLHLFKKCAADSQQEKDSVASTAMANSSKTIASSNEPNNYTINTVVGGSPSPHDLKPLLPVMHEGGLQVRNTFIHSDSISVDDRAVQSMPHGMFRQCILSEASLGALADEVPEFPSDMCGMTYFPTTPSSVCSEPEMEPFAEQAKQNLPISIGALVIVEGLVKAPGFNGRSAVVQSWDEATGRYNIVLASASGSQQAKIKEENLRMILPCPESSLGFIASR